MAVTKSKSATFAKGGSSKMAPLQGAKPSKPGVTSVSSAGKGASFASGGGGHMFPQQTSCTSPKDGVGLSCSGKPGKGNFAKGGSTKMFGQQHAGPATAGASVK